MRLAGIITEYDPFHAGHAWQLRRARELGAQVIAVCMSEDLTQRGSAALLPPAVRAAAALDAGADLVIGLPNPCAVQSAEGFAAAGVAALSALPGLDSLVFGAETPDTDALMETARVLCSPEFDRTVKQLVGQGMAFAAARAAAAGSLHPCAREILAHPNNNLGVEYCKAILRQGSSLVPVPVQRTGAQHGQQTPGEEGFASASYLRGLWRRQGVQALAPYVPAAALERYQKAAAQGLDLDGRAFSVAVLSRLRAMDPTRLAAARGAAEGLEHRLAAAVCCAPDLESLYAAMKTKRYAHARLRRYALCAALGYGPDLPQTPPYLHVLAANRAGLSLLKGAALPADTSLAALEKKSEAARQMARAHAAGADLAALCRRIPGPMGSSYTQKPCLITGDSGNNFHAKLTNHCSTFCESCISEKKVL